MTQNIIQVEKIPDNREKLKRGIALPASYYRIAKRYQAFTGFYDDAADWCPFVQRVLVELIENNGLEHKRPMPTREVLFISYLKRLGKELPFEKWISLWSFDSQGLIAECWLEDDHPDVVLVHSFAGEALAYLYSDKTSQPYTLIQDPSQIMLRYLVDLVYNPKLRMSRLPGREGTKSSLVSTFEALNEKIQVTPKINIAGFYFKDGVYVYPDSKSQTVIYYPYGAGSLFTTHTIDALGRSLLGKQPTDYLNPEPLEPCGEGHTHSIPQLLQGDPMGTDQLFTSAEELEFQQFIYETCGYNSWTALCCRCIFQRGLHAFTQGTDFQSGFWLHGLPATGKSFLIEWFKAIFGEGQVVGVDGSNNNKFTVQILKDARIVYCDDPINLTEGFREIMKRALAGGSMPGELKLKNKYFSIKPYFTLIIVTNSPPEAFDFYHEPGIKEKIVRVPFYDIIPVGKRKPTSCLKKRCVSYATQTLLWAQTTPVGWGEQMNRAEAAEAFLVNRGLTMRPNLHDQYIIECLVTEASPDWEAIKDPLTVSVAELKSNFKVWCTVNGCEEIYNNRCISTLKTRLVNHFNLLIPVKRGPQMVSATGNTLRPRELRHVALLDQVQHRSQWKKISLAHRSEPFEYEITDVLWSKFGDTGKPNLTTLQWKDLHFFQSQSHVINPCLQVSTTETKVDHHEATNLSTRFYPTLNPIQEPFQADFSFDQREVRNAYEKLCATRKDEQASSSSSLLPGSIIKGVSIQLGETKEAEKIQKQALLMYKYRREKVLNFNALNLNSQELTTIIADSLESNPMQVWGKVLAKKEEELLEPLKEVTEKQI